ncbi:hypothetical protein BS78_08G158600 [Paspalum vaginatum]|nr:hypothetical protein BS78_08G158600 [Paspalum vaginatum]
MGGRRFLNLVTKNCANRVYSLRRIKLAGHLFYPSTAAAESAAARREAKNARMRAAGHRRRQHGLQALRTVARSLGRLPAPRINLAVVFPTTNAAADVDLDFVTLLDGENKILCGDSRGHTCLSDADAHSVVTVPSLGDAKGPHVIPINIRRHDKSRLRHAAERRRPRPPAAHRWTCLLSPPFIQYRTRQAPADVCAHVVAGSTIYVSTIARGFGTTYTFDTASRRWELVGGYMGKWILPFFGGAEHIPELGGLWFGLSATRPFHLCTRRTGEEGQPSPSPATPWSQNPRPRCAHHRCGGLGEGRSGP